MFQYDQSNYLFHGSTQNEIKLCLSPPGVALPQSACFALTLRRPWLRYFYPLSFLTGDPKYYLAQVAPSGPFPASTCFMHWTLCWERTTCLLLSKVTSSSFFSSFHQPNVLSLLRNKHLLCFLLPLVSFPKWPQVAPVLFPNHLLKVILHKVTFCCYDQVKWIQPQFCAHFTKQK